MTKKNHHNEVTSEFSATTTSSLKQQKISQVEQLNPLNANPAKPTSCLCVFDYFVGLALKGLSIWIYFKTTNSVTVHY